MISTNSRADERPARFQQFSATLPRDRDFCWTRRFDFGNFGTRARMPLAASVFDRVDPAGTAGGDRRFRVIPQSRPRL
jgi:hypothetical protein